MQPFSELHEVERRYEELAYKMSTPEAAADADAYAQMMRDYKELTPLMEEYRRYTALQKDEQEAKEVLQQDSDPAFTAMVQQELCEIARNLAQSEENLRLLLPKDENDDRSVIVEIRGGAGGEEAALFAHSLFRMYTMYAETRGWKYEVLNANETELGGMKEVSFSIEGEGAYSRLKFESGVHRVQRVPETETQGRVHTSTVTVAVHARGRGGRRSTSTPPTCRSTPSVPRARAASTSIKRHQRSASRICPRGWWWNVRTSAASTRIRTRRSRCCAAVCWRKNRPQHDGLKSRPSATARWARETAPSVSAPTTIPQGRVTDHRIGLTLYKLDSDAGRCRWTEVHRRR